MSARSGTAVRPLPRHRSAVRQKMLGALERTGSLGNLAPPEIAARPWRTAAHGRPRPAAAPDDWEDGLSPIRGRGRVALDGGRGGRDDGLGGVLRAGRFSLGRVRIGRVALELVFAEFPGHRVTVLLHGAHRAPPAKKYGAYGNYTHFRGEPEKLACRVGFAQYITVRVACQEGDPIGIDVTNAPTFGYNEGRTVLAGKSRTVPA